MANGKAQKTLRQLVEGESLAANALAVAVSKVKDGGLKDLLSQLHEVHVANVDEAGKQLQAQGGKYTFPELRDQLKNGWEAIATSKTTTEALKHLEKKEREALVKYKGLLSKAPDEQTISLILKNMSANTEVLSKLSESLSKLQEKKKGRFLGLPLAVWGLGLAGGAGYYFYRRFQTPAVPPSTPASDAGNSNS